MRRNSQRAAAFLLVSCLVSGSGPVEAGPSFLPPLGAPPAQDPLILTRQALVQRSAWTPTPAPSLNSGPTERILQSAPRPAVLGGAPVGILAALLSFVGAADFARGQQQAATPQLSQPAGNPLQVTFPAKTVRADASLLPRALQIHVEKFLSDLENYRSGSAQRYGEKAIENLNAALFKAGYAATGIEDDSSEGVYRLVYFKLDLKIRQQRSMQGMKGTLRGTLFPAEFASGDEQLFRGSMLAFNINGVPNTALMVSSEIRAEADKIHALLSKTSQAEAEEEAGSYAGYPHPVVLAILRHYFAGKSVDEIAAILEETTADHEYLHMWFAFLDPANDPNADPQTTELRHEAAAYDAQLAYSRIPYFQLLKHAGGRWGGDDVARGMYESLSEASADAPGLSEDPHEAAAFILRRIKMGVGGFPIFQALKLLYGWWNRDFPPGPTHPKELFIHQFARTLAGEQFQGDLPVFHPIARLRAAPGLDQEGHALMIDLGVSGDGAARLSTPRVRRRFLSAA